MEISANKFIASPLASFFTSMLHLWRLYRRQFKWFWADSWEAWCLRPLIALKEGSVGGQFEWLKLTATLLEVAVARIIVGWRQAARLILLLVIILRVVISSADGFFHRLWWEKEVSWLLSSALFWSGLHWGALVMHDHLAVLVARVELCAALTTCTVLALAAKSRQRRR